MIASFNVATTVTVAVSSIVALVGLVLTILNRRDKKAADAEAKDRSDDKERLDTLSLGQEWVVKALALSNADNERLRLRVAELEMAVANCTDECAKLKRAVENKP